MKKIVLISDVFGKTQALEQLSSILNAYVIDPYDGRMINFADEAEAYQCFMSEIGLDRYLDKVKTALEKINFNGILIGFSVGASTVWRLSEMLDENTIKHAICFYGSQIRNFTAVNPQCPIELVFPKSEPHFDVLALKNILSKKAKAKVIIVDGLHGFMNKHSINYSEQLYLSHLNRLRFIVQN